MGKAKHAVLPGQQSIFSFFGGQKPAPKTDGKTNILRAASTEEKWRKIMPHAPEESEQVEEREKETAPIVSIATTAVSSGTKRKAAPATAAEERPAVSLSPAEKDAKEEVIVTKKTRRKTAQVPESKKKSERKSLPQRSAKLSGRKNAKEVAQDKTSEGDKDNSGSNNKTTEIDSGSAEFVNESIDLPSDEKSAAECELVTEAQAPVPKPQQAAKSVTPNAGETYTSFASRAMRAGIPLAEVGRVWKERDGAAADTENDDSSSSEDDEPPPPPNPNNYELSDYEKMRLERIRRNHAYLKSLGLDGGFSGTGQQHKDVAKKKTSGKKRKGVSTSVSAVPESERRRSGRLKGVKVADSTKEAVLDDEDDWELPEEPEPEYFNDSLVIKYAMSTENATAASSERNEHSRALQSWWKPPVPTNPKLCLLPSTPFGSPILSAPVGLNNIYSLEFCEGRDRCVVAGGKSGVMCLWDLESANETTGEEDEGNDKYTNNTCLDASLAWKGHAGKWIASAKFLRSATDTNYLRLISAGNNGTVCFWDLMKQRSSGEPKLVGESGKNLHTNGIFSLDCRMSGSNSPIIATGSKDKSMAVSTILGDGNIVRTFRGDFHSKQVTDVRISNYNYDLIGSASSDGLVCVCDIRSKKSVINIDNAHNIPQSIVWGLKDHQNEHTVMTSGNDDIIKIWDIRSYKKPVSTLRGHCSANGKNNKIHHPHFTTFGQSSTHTKTKVFVVTGGQGSSAISIYDLAAQAVKNGSIPAMSRGELPDGCGDAGSIAISKDSGRVIASVEGGEVLLLTV